MDLQKLDLKEKIVTLSGKNPAYLRLIIMFIKQLIGAQQLELSIESNFYNSQLINSYLLKRSLEKLTAQQLLELDHHTTWELLSNPQKYFSEQLIVKTKKRFPNIIGQLKKILVNLITMLNPKMSLTREELACSRYSKLFGVAGMVDRSFNARYRKLLKQFWNDHQIYNSFLQEIGRISKNNKQAKFAHKLLTAAELALLGGQINNRGNAKLFDEDLITRIRENWEKVIFIVKQKQPHNSSLFTDSKIIQAKIDYMCNTVARLLLKLRSEEQQLAQLPKAEKLNLYKQIQAYKRKILHFVVKTDALAEQTTSIGNQEWNVNYIQRQFAKIPLEAATKQTQNLAHKALDTSKIFNLFPINPNNEYDNPNEQARNTCQLQPDLDHIFRLIDQTSIYAERVELINQVAKLVEQKEFGKRLSSAKLVLS